MKITIDTASDSEEDIRKVIALLSTLVDRSKHGDVFSAATPGVSMPDNVFGLFENAPRESSESSPATKKQEKEPFKIDGLERY